MKVICLQLVVLRGERGSWDGLAKGESKITKVAKGNTNFCAIGSKEGNCSIE